MCRAGDVDETFKTMHISRYLREIMAMAGLRNSYAIVRAGMIDVGACSDGNAKKLFFRSQVMQVERVPSASQHTEPRKRAAIKTVTRVTEVLQLFHTAQPRAACV